MGLIFDHFEDNNPHLCGVGFLRKFDEFWIIENGQLLVESAMCHVVQSRIKSVPVLCDLTSRQEEWSESKDPESEFVFWEV